MTNELPKTETTEDVEARMPKIRFGAEDAETRDDDPEASGGRWVEPAEGGRWVEPA